MELLLMAESHTTSHNVLQLCIWMLQGWIKVLLSSHNAGTSNWNPFSLWKAAGATAVAQASMPMGSGQPKTHACNMTEPSCIQTEDEDEEDVLAKQAAAKESRQWRFGVVRVALPVKSKSTHTWQRFLQDWITWGDLQPDCPADRPVTGPHQPTPHP